MESVLGLVFWVPAPSPSLTRILWMAPEMRAFPANLEGAFRLLLNQPRQGLLAALESYKFAPREGFHVPLEHWREVLRPYPCRFSDIGLIEHRAFLHCPNSFVVKRRSCEIRE